MLRAALYVRVSSDKQIDNTSIPLQTSVGQEYCKNHNMRLIRIFEEKGESATILDRTEIVKLIEFVKSGNIDILLIYKYDRLARNLGDFLYLKKLLKTHNVKIISITEPIEDSPAGEFLEHMLSAVAQFDNQVRRDRAINGIKARLESGVWCFAPPIGYVREKTTPKGAQPPTLDSNCWEIIRDGFERFATGNYSQKNIAQFYTQAGVLGTGGRKLTRKSTHKMIRNIFYCGIIDAPKYNVYVEGKHPKIIDINVFKKMEEVIDFRSKNNIKMYKPIPDFKLNQLFNCDSCDRKLTGSWSRSKNGNHYGYYACTYEKCSKHLRIRKEKLESEFEYLLTQLTISNRVLNLLEKRMSRQYTSRVKTLNAKQKESEKKIKDLIERKERIQEAFESGIYDSQTYKKRMDKVSLELSRSKNEDMHIEYTLDNLEENLKSLRVFLEHPVEFWKGLSDKDLQGFYRLIAPTGINWENGRARTPESIIFNGVIGDFTCTPVSHGGDEATNLEQITQKLIEFSEKLSSLFNLNLSAL